MQPSPVPSARLSGVCGCFHFLVNVAEEVYGILKRFSLRSCFPGPGLDSERVKILAAGILDAKRNALKMRETTCEAHVWRFLFFLIYGNKMIVIQAENYAEALKNCRPVLVRGQVF